MLTKRIIPCLDVKAGRVVKGVRFRDHRDAGETGEDDRNLSDSYESVISTGITSESSPNGSAINGVE